MSEFGEGDYCPVWEESWRTARKDHNCHACQETIHPGHRYHYTFIVYDGSPDVTKRCERCQLIFEHLSARIRDEGDDEEFCNPTLSCGHEYKNRWGEAPPEWLSALAFWLPGDPLPELPEIPKRP